MVKGEILASIADEKAGEGERQAQMKTSTAKDSTPSPHSEHQETNQTAAGPPLGPASLKAWLARAADEYGGEAGVKV